MYTLIKNFSMILNLDAINFYFLLTGILSVLVGSIALNNQWFIKRFFAYSGISHIGFLLLALYGSDTQSFIIYSIIYGITTLNIFIILIMLSSIYGRELKSIKDLHGIFKLNSTLSMIFALN